MIRTFRSAETKALFDTGKSPRFQPIERVALRKLMMWRDGDAEDVEIVDYH
jgi:plasmid maintenance system killer protein